MALPLSLQALIQLHQLAGTSIRRVPIGGGGEVGRLLGGSEGGDGVRECFFPARGKTEWKRPVNQPAGST